MSRTLIEELNELHASYVDVINAAVAEDDLTRADELADSYDRDAVQVVAQREGKEHLAPLALRAAGARRATTTPRVGRHRLLARRAVRKAA